MTFSLKNVFSAQDKSEQQRTRRVVGIDCGSSSIKVVEVEQDGNILQLKTYGELQLGPYANLPLGHSVDLPVKTKIEAIVDVLRESNVEATDAIMTLPLSGSFITTISISAPSKEDISPKVNVEARKYVPIPLSDVALEWTEVDPLEGTPDSVREVLIAAIQNKVLVESKEILKSIGKVSQPSEIELFSTLRSIFKETDVSIAILDLGAESSKMYISEGGYLRRVHRARGGGATVTSHLEKNLEITFEEAENLKRSFSENDTHAAEIKKAIAVSFERPLQEFKRVLGQYELRSGKSVSRIVLTGGAASFPGIISFVDYALGRNTVKSNPFTKVSYPAFMEDTIVEIAPTFATALGAALRPFEQ